MELWREEFLCEITFSKYYSFNSCGDVIHAKLGQKVPELVFYAPMGIEIWKPIAKGKLRWSIRFWNHSLKILKFWLSVLTSLTQKCIKKAQGCISFTNDDTKMGIKRKRYFEKNHSFMRPSSQNFEVLIQRGDVVKLHSLVKGPKLVSHVLIVIQRWKSKVKGTLRWGICLWNYFLKILKF